MWLHGQKIRWLLLALVLAACQPQATGPDPVPPSRTPVPVAPTRTATIAPAPTSTPTVAPTAEGDRIFDFEFVAKVLPLGASGAFDDYAVWAPEVVFHDGLFHMFYTAFDNRQFNNSTIGYASSPDGMTWTKFSGNPILVGPEAFPKLQSPAVMVESGRWVMYLDGGENGSPLNQDILRATSSSPSGPWRLDPEPVLRGVPLSWDFLNQPVTAQRVDASYYLFYSGVGGPGPQMGVATSPDGRVWSMYDDPNTSDHPNKTSDPILASGGPGEWDQGGLASYEVLYTNGQWEMFYIGFPEDPFGRNSGTYEEALGVGYATSSDGVHWEKYPANPAFSSEERTWPLLEAIRLSDGRYFLYYDIDGGPGGLGLMAGTVTLR